MVGTIVGSIVGFIIVVIILALSIRTVRPTSRGLIERFGRYKRFANPGIIHSSSAWFESTSRKIW
jgi:regulator of protease activity HflC (stomatin/prohibitin superfamily)